MTGVVAKVKRVAPAAVALSMLVVGAAGVAPVRAQGTDLSTLQGKITADGSSTVGPITQAVAEEFGKEAKGVQVTVDISGTGGGFKRFCNGETDIQDASRPIKAEEAAACADKGVDYYRFEVAYDGITVVVNKENTFLTCMTTDELKRLWEKDSTVKTWADLKADYPAETIALYGPGTDSGTFDYFTQAIVGADGNIREDFTPSEDDNVLVEGVAGDKNALGYFGYAYFEENTDKLNAVGVDSGDGNCVLPSKQTIQDGTYKPLSRPLYVYVKAESMQRPEVGEFMKFYVQNAKQLVDSVGFIDSPDQVYTADAEKLDRALGGQGIPDSKATPAAEATPAA